MASSAPCFHCHRYPNEGEPPLQRCSSCKSRYYCSKGCQRSDWKQHKQECQRVASGGELTPRVRTTTRMNLASLLGEETPDPDTIYYLKTSKPHIKDISISGPFYPLDTVSQQIRSRLAKERSIEGRTTFEELLRDVSLAGIAHLNAPLPDGHVMNLEIMHEKNPGVAATLGSRRPNQPISTYSVFHMTPDPEVAARNYGEPKFMPVAHAGIHATFTTKEAANQSARELFNSWKKGPHDTIRIMPQANGLVAGCLMGPDGVPKKTLEVRHDDGGRRCADGSIIY